MRRAGPLTSHSTQGRPGESHPYPTSPNPLPDPPASTRFCPTRQHLKTTQCPVAVRLSPAPPPTAQGSHRTTVCLRPAWLLDEFKARLARRGRGAQWAEQSHLHPILVVIEFLEGTGRQLLFPPGLGSSLLLCGGEGGILSCCATSGQIQTPPNLPSPHMASHRESSLTLSAGFNEGPCPLGGRTDSGTR